ncbi:AI-2E family transporter [Candidatus Saccharibacteria bacterium]|nr:AI-2E family transporter [Candidatus Saccharibacteria bacterium]
MSKAIEVDTKTFIRFWLVILGLGLVALFLWKALTGLVIVGISIFLAIAIKPLVKKVDQFDKKKKRPVLSATVAYIIVMGVICVVFAVIGPVVINETVRFVGQLPETFQETLGGWDGINNFGQSIGVENLQGEITIALQGFSNDFVKNFGTTLVSSVSTIANVLTASVLVLVLTLLFLLEGPGLVDSIWKAIGGNDEKNRSAKVVRRIVGRMADVVSVYMSKQVTIALLDGLVVALTVFVLSLIFGFSSSLAFPMGLIAAIFYLIPMFGQIISTVLVSLLLFFSSPAAALTFAIAYIIYAQIENNAIAPKIQGDALNLPAVVILASITIGMYMFGLLGAIIAIPIAGCVKVLIEEYPNIKAIG